MITTSSSAHRIWERQPAAEALVQRLLNEALEKCGPASQFANALLERTAVRLRDIVDHLALSSDVAISEFESTGWRRGQDGAWRKVAGGFPTIIRRDEFQIWLRVESVDQFLAANSAKAVVEAKAYGPLRRALVFSGDAVAFGVIERNGFAGYDPPDVSDALIRQARQHLQRFRTRRRAFGSVEEGLAHTEALVERVVRDIGPHWACDLWLKAERDFWLRQCAAGRFVRTRQDAIGIGWANIDHHTYDSSRRHFRHAIQVFEKLGYEPREMLYAGELAGWGSQVLEQPVIGSTIFADVDLAPDELTIDFAHEPLSDLPKHRRAGLLSAVLGESILEPGLTHLACLSDHRRFREQMRQLGVSMMAPFSDFSHLYQELTDGDWGAVDPDRVDRLEADGHIGAEEAERLRLEGSIVTHFENIERNDGYKGFNRDGIDSVLRKLDPRAYLSTQSASA